MSFFIDIRASLAEMFADEPFLPATITRETKGGYDPKTRRTSTGAVASIPCRAFPDTAIVKSADGSQTANTTVLMSVAPIIGDKIEIAGTVYTVTIAAVNDLTGLHEATVTS